MESIPAASGIYKITCTTTDKVYVGSAINLRSRYSCHFSHLRTHRHDNIYLQRAFDKYGEDAFTFTVIELVLAPCLIEREQYWIDTLQALDKKRGFNMAPKAGSRFGLKATDEVRAKMSRATKGKPKSREHRAKISAALRGRPKPATVGAKLSATRRAEKERRQQERALQQFRVYKPPKLPAFLKPQRPPGPGKGGKGVPKSAAHRAAIKAAFDQTETKTKLQTRNARMWDSEAYREKQGTALKAAMADPDVHARRVAAMRATMATPEYKAKMSAAVKAAARRKIEKETQG